LGDLHTRENASEKKGDLFLVGGAETFGQKKRGGAGYVKEEAGKKENTYSYEKAKSLRFKQQQLVKGGGGLNKGDRIGGGKTPPFGKKTSSTKRRGNFI